MMQRTEQFFRRMERYTKIDMVYLMEGGFWVTLGQIVSSLTVFLIAMAFANLLPKETYGSYKYVLSLAGLVGALSLTGLNTAVVQSVARGFEGVLKKAFWTNIRWSAPICAVSTLAAIYYGIRGDPFLAVSFVIIGAFYPLLNSAQLYSAFLNGKQEFRRKTLYEIGDVVVPAVCMLGAIYLSGNALVLVLVYFLSNTAFTLFLYLRTRVKYKPNDREDEGVVRYSAHLSLINILDTVANNIDKVLVFHVIGVGELAVYAFATGIPDQIKPFLKGLTNLILPRFAERSTASIRQNLWDKVGKLFLFNILMASIYIPLAPIFYKIAFPQYLDAVPYSQAFAVSFLAGSIMPIEIFLIAKKKIREQYFIKVIIAVFQIAAVILCVILWGLWGLIIARVATRFFASIPNIYFYSRISDE